jgi:phospholipid/cholesterol/gamma-HCH transport system permease protein
MGGFFGVVAALTGCLRGMQCGTNAAAVGQATTSGVVTGIAWIIASDGIFAAICSALGSSLTLAENIGLPFAWL